MGLGWNGFANGYIPTGQLAAVPNFHPLGSGPASIAAGSNLMRADAARQLSGMMQAFWNRFKKVLSLSEGYRPIVNQNWYYNRFMKKLPGWTLAAFPGTSIHGWALSADLNIEGSNPAGEYLQWLRDNAHLWGFVNDVATETWHWSFRTDLVTATTTIKVLIANPQGSSSEGSPSHEGDEDLDHLFKNKKTNQIAWLNVSGGFWYDVREDYVPAIEGHIGRKLEIVEDGWWGFWKDRVDGQRDRIASRAADLVWAKKISGFNGVHSASERLAGIDKKADDLAAASRTALVNEIVKAIPAATVTTGGLDATSIAKTIASLITPAIVSGVGNDLAARLKA